MPPVICARCDRVIRHNESATFYRGRYRHKKCPPVNRPVKSGRNSLGSRIADGIGDVLESVAEIFD